MRADIDAGHGEARALADRCGVSAILTKPSHPDAILETVQRVLQTEPKTTGPVTDDLLARAEVVEVYAIHVPVLPPTDVLASKLLALREHNLDFAPMLEIARSLREQIDWDELRRRTDGSPYAKPFFTLVDELGLAA